MKMSNVKAQMINEIQMAYGKYILPERIELPDFPLPERGRVRVGVYIFQRG